MARLPDAVIGHAYASDAAWELLVDLVEVGDRMAGHAGEAEGAAIMERAFEEHGFRGVRRDEFDIPGWRRGQSAVGVHTGDVDLAFDEPHQVLALPGTPVDATEAELVDCGYGLPEEMGPAVENRIAMVRSDTPEDHRWVHRMEKYVAAVDAGALGFVFRNHVPGCLPATGEIGYHRRPAPIPAVGVSAEVGARIERYAEDGPPGILLSVDCRHESATSANVQGAVGPNTDEEVLVTAHVDAHDIAEGAADNGVGCALVAEVGRLLSMAEDELDTAVRLIAFGAEETGLHGAYHHAEETDPDRIKCVVNIDGAGPSRTLRLRSNGFDAVANAVEAATDDLGAPIEVDDEITPHADDWAFVERGIPAVTAGSATGGSDRGWGHTHADTLDKLDERDLRALAITIANAVVEIADDDRSFPREDPTDVRDALDEGYLRELEGGNRWHFE